MPDTKAELRKARGQLANTSRHHPENVSALDALRRRIKQLNLELAVQQAVATAPPISESQAVAIADLLVKGAAGRADVA